MWKPTCAFFKRGWSLINARQRKWSIVNDGLLAIEVRVGVVDSLLVRERSTAVGAVAKLNYDELGSLVDAERTACQQCRRSMPSVCWSIRADAWSGSPVSLMLDCCCNQRLMTELLSSIADAVAADWSAAVVAAVIDLDLEFRTWKLWRSIDMLRWSMLIQPDHWCCCWSVLCRQQSEKNRSSAPLKITESTTRMLLWDWPSSW